MRLYIRKDVAAQLWDYGIAASPEEVVADPYEGKETTLLPDRFFGELGAAPGQFNAPRGLAVASDGTLWVTDSRNHRIQHLDPDGNVLHVFGSFADAAAGNAPGGTFNEPWDIAISEDGFVYVADTWNHRIQKFDSQGQFLAMWGYFGTAETPDAFWGPRSVAVDTNGNVTVTDTGNKRIVTFDPNGNFISQFGSVGFAPGQFDEPVGIEIDAAGRLYVADTWNQRIQIMAPIGDSEYTPSINWEVYGWFGQSLENKPYLSVDSTRGNLFVADPEGYRVLQFTADGEFIRYWGDYSTDVSGFGLVSGLAVDPEGGLWVSDGANNRLLHFTIP
jgi:DNA-binding beta-propeller fold protein YncE